MSEGLVRFEDKLGGSVWINPADVAAIFQGWGPPPQGPQGSTRFNGHSVASINRQPKTATAIVLRHRQSEIMVAEDPDVVAARLQGRPEPTPLATPATPTLVR